MTPGSAAVLQQNTGEQAKVVRLLEGARGRYGDSLATCPAGPHCQAPVDPVVRKMPLRKFQAVGDARLDFLYPNTGSGKSIYYGDGLRDGGVEVYHFIPWSRHSADLGHNFVLADRRRNNQRRDCGCGAPGCQGSAKWSVRQPDSVGAGLAGHHISAGGVKPRGVLGLCANRGHRRADLVARR